MLCPIANGLIIFKGVRGMVCHMTTYIALLRGINVGGKNMIKMTELKRMFASMGLCEVQTYIQSGNVLFKSADEEQPLRDKIERGIETAFGLSLTVVLRTAAELQQLVRICPFSADEVAKAEACSTAESLYVALLTHSPSQEKILDLRSYQGEGDNYQVIGREVFLLFHNSIRNSRLASNLHRLNVPITVRNFKTISKLAALAEAMQ